jgi:hypothetical protein
MKYFFLLTFIFFVFNSCNHQEKFPTKITHIVSDEMIKFDTNVFEKTLGNKSDSNAKSAQYVIIDELTNLGNEYQERTEDFNFQNLLNLWEQCKTEIETQKLEYPIAKKWIAATGLLLETTADARFAKELQFLLNQSEYQKVKKKAASYVFTKNVLVPL